MLLNWIQIFLLWGWIAVGFSMEKTSKDPCGLVVMEFQDLFLKTYQTTAFLIKLPETQDPVLLIPTSSSPLWQVSSNIQVIGPTESALKLRLDKKPLFRVEESNDCFTCIGFQWENLTEFQKKQLFAWATPLQYGEEEMGLVSLYSLNQSSTNIPKFNEISCSILEKQVKSNLPIFGLTSLSNAPISNPIGSPVLNRASQLFGIVHSCSKNQVFVYPAWLLKQFFDAKKDRRIGVSIELALTNAFDVRPPIPENQLENLMEIDKSGLVIQVEKAVLTQDSSHSVQPGDILWSFQEQGPLLGSNLNTLLRSEEKEIQVLRNGQTIVVDIPSIDVQRLIGPLQVITFGGLYFARGGSSKWYKVSTPTLFVKEDCPVLLSIGGIDIEPNKFDKLPPDQLLNLINGKSATTEWVVSLQNRQLGELCGLQQGVKIIKGTFPFGLWTLDLKNLTWGFVDYR
jgi:hypothetical protein